MERTTGLLFWFYGLTTKLNVKCTSKAIIKTQIQFISLVFVHNDRIFSFRKRKIMHNINGPGQYCSII